jgi:hypothetical protein
MAVVMMWDVILELALLGGLGFWMVSGFSLVL